MNYWVSIVSVSIEVGMWPKSFSYELCQIEVEPKVRNTFRPTKSNVFFSFLFLFY
ncbi:hypothetical protein HanRHA438_Chr04g0190071 [Helianthus annuus]|nr:hypothetical protein HanRHA438_Chr04g0190071 [Helianthus annuus]